MILESRSIIFSDDELVVALKPVQEAKSIDPNILPCDIIIGFDGENEVQVIYKFEENPDQKYNSREVGAAVLNHCIDQGIPLPRGSYKELTLRGNHVALIVRLETGGSMEQLENDGE